MRGSPEFESLAGPKQRELRKMADDELIGLEISLSELQLQAEKKQAAYPDPVLIVAVSRETHRRYVASSWLWTRWRKPHEYEKWVEHRAEVERRDLQLAQLLISKDYPDIMLDIE